MTTFLPTLSKTAKLKRNALTLMSFMPFPRRGPFVFKFQKHLVLRCYPFSFDSVLAYYARNYAKLIKCIYVFCSTLIWFFSTIIGYWLFCSYFKTKVWKQYKNDWNNKMFMPSWVSTYKALVFSGWNCFSWSRFS